MRHVFVILLLVVLTGCGSKGALFLPKDETADTQPASVQPESAPATEAAPSDEAPAVEQTTPQEDEDDTVTEPLWEEEDDEDINL